MSVARRLWTKNGGRKTVNEKRRTTDFGRKMLDEKRWTKDLGRKTLDEIRWVKDGGRKSIRIVLPYFTVLSCKFMTINPNKWLGVYVYVASLYHTTQRSKVKDRI